MRPEMRVVSGIQPTGNLHLGNYLGAIRNWVRMQDEMKDGEQCLFFLADLHAISMPHTPAELHKATLEMAAAVVACGIDPQRSVLFNQAQVPAHAELQWLLNGTARMGWLNRMTQWKDKAGKNREGQSVALFGYPVLQAADVLLYQTTHVPVGEDQKQHLELARDIAQKFNNDFASEDAPVVRLCNAILLNAIKQGASDIHVEPYERVLRVRYRVDGVLHEEMTPPIKLKNAIASRLKIMSSLDIAERRLPQDGRIKLKLGKGREMDYRVSSVPTLWGEKIVLRLLDKSNLQLDMTKLGFESEQLGVFQKNIHQPYGMVLVTGPTGSGKTTTLYSALSELNLVSENLSTAEDPVEFNLTGINQVQMHEEIGRAELHHEARLRNHVVGILRAAHQALDLDLLSADLSGQVGERGIRGVQVVHSIAV